MVKDFNNWSAQKARIEDLQLPMLDFREREVWWCSVGLNIGDEEDGKNIWYERPVLILRKFNSRITWVVPLTSKKKEGKYYSTLKFQGNESTAILSQLKLMSSKRLRRKISRISKTQMLEIKKKIISLL